MAVPLVYHHAGGWGRKTEWEPRVRTQSRLCSSKHPELQCKIQTQKNVDSESLVGFRLLYVIKMILLPGYVSCLALHDDFPDILLGPTPEIQCTHCSGCYVEVFVVSKHSAPLVYWLWTRQILVLCIIIHVGKSSGPSPSCCMTN